MLSSVREYVDETEDEVLTRGGIAAGIDQRALPSHKGQRKQVLSFYSGALWHLFREGTLVRLSNPEVASRELQIAVRRLRCRQR